jgi:hypothetical protein
VAQQGSPPPSSRPYRRFSAHAGRGGAEPGGGYSWDNDTFAESEQDYPPWAGVEVTPRRAEREARPREGVDHLPEGLPERAPVGRQAGPGFRSRLLAARSRRTRRMTYIWGGALVAVVVIIAGLYLAKGHSAAPAQSGGFVQTYLPGEFKTVPSTCASVTTATLSRYLPGTRRQVAPHSLDGRAQSLCNWTVDAPPLYRLLQVNSQAYAPTGLASGNGSATAAATDAYQRALRLKRHPPKATHLPKALLTAVPGLGDSAFAAFQRLSAGGDTTDLMTVVLRHRNVLITVQLQGLDRSSRGRYGPVSVSQLRAGAIAAARDVLSQFH